jgi:PAS domain S-box-containing protein
MTTPVADDSANAAAQAQERHLLAIAATLFSPELDTAAIIEQIVDSVAATLGAAVAFLPSDRLDTVPQATAFATEVLRSTFQDTSTAITDEFQRAQRAEGPVLVTDGVGDLSWLSVPLCSHNARFGTLFVARDNPTLTPDELSMLERVALPVIGALGRAAQSTVDADETRVITLLTAVEAILTARIDDADTLVTVMSTLVGLIGTALGESCALFLIEREQPALLLIDLYHANPAEQERQRAAIYAAPPRLGEEIIGTIALGRNGQIIAPAADGRSWLCVPLHQGGQPLGALTLSRSSSSAALGPRELLLCESIGTRIATALNEVALRQRVTTAQDLLADSPDPAFTLSIGGHLLSANTALCALLGYSAAQLRERHIGDLLASEERDATLELLATVITGGTPIAPHEWTFVRANGERRIIEVRGKVLTELGQPVEIHCAGRDLTARHEDQRALARQGTELATLHIAGLTLADTLDPSEIRQALLGALRAAISCEDVTIYSLQAGQMQPELALQWGTASPPEFPHGHELIDESVLHGQSVLLNDAPSDPEFVNLHEHVPLHLLIVPLLAGGQTRGCVVLRRLTGAPYTLNDLRLVESIATPAALTLQNASLHAETSGMTADMRAVLESIQQGILLTDKAGHVRFANRRLGEMLGVDVRTIIGWHDLDIAERLLAQQARDPKGLLARLTWLNEHFEETSTDEVALSRATGQILDRYTGPMRHPDSGAIVGRIIVYTDVTAVRQLERAKDEFLATASHELKTPITTLGGYLELLGRQVAQPAGPDPVRLTRYISTARGELARLQRLSEDLLEVARIEAGRLTLQLATGDLAQTVSETVERFVRRPGLEERGHRIVCEATEPLPIAFDALRIGQVVGNLLENALKYSPTGGDVFVTAQRVGAQGLVTVRDSGIGVPESEREQLFLPFYRTTNASVGSPEGLGLGLYISRGIVEGHGGRIWAEPAPDQGTIFKVLLPLAEKQQVG